MIRRNPKELRPLRISTPDVEVDIKGEPPVKFADGSFWPSEEIPAQTGTFGDGFTVGITVGLIWATGVMVLIFFLIAKVRA